MRALRRSPKTDLTVGCNRIKGFRRWLACAWVALPLLVHADAPAVNPQALGISESILNYCGSVDPAAAAKLRDKIKQLVRGASEQQLAQARNSDEYRKAYDSVVDFAGKVDPRNAKRFCSATPHERK